MPSTYEEVKVDIKSEAGKRTGAKPGSYGLMAIAIIPLIIMGCASRQAHLPPITPEPTNTYWAGSVVWYDLATPDIGKARGFYEALFGWEFPASGDPDYLLATFQGQPVAGLVRIEPRKQEDNNGVWIPAISVTDVDEAARSIQKLGGEILTEPADLRERGRLALVRDPHGAEFVILSARGGDPMKRAPEAGEWIWTELWTRDPDSSKSFYRSLIGYEIRPVSEQDGSEYLLFEKDGVAKAGVVEIPWKDVESGWLPYIKVRDVAQTAKRAVELGGRSVLGPSESLEGGSLAILVDPTGAAFAVQQPSEKKGRDK